MMMMMNIADFEESLEVLSEEITDNLQQLPEDLTNILNFHHVWQRDRNDLILYLGEISDQLRLIHRNGNKTAITTSSISLVGGVAVVGGLFATSAISLPLIAIGGAVSAVSTLSQMTACAGETIRTHSLLKKCEREIERDGKSLKTFLESVDAYIKRVQCLEKQFSEQKELRKSRATAQTSYYAIRVGKSVYNYCKSINEMEKAIVTAKRSVNIFQTLSSFMKSSRLYQAVFRTASKGAAPTVAKAGAAGARLFGKKLFAVLGLGVDIFTIADASTRLKEDSLPQAAEELNETIRILVTEKVTIDTTFLEAVELRSD